MRMSLEEIFLSLTTEDLASAPPTSESTVSDVDNGGNAAQTGEAVNG
jgi:hypothetical protein